MLRVMKKVLTIMACAGGATIAHAGPGVEANGARADGHWGGEVGAGYALDLAGFSLTPGAGLLLHDGNARLYGRIEAAFQIPASARIGAGVRFSGDHSRPYGTVAFPVLPMVALKGNVGPKYYALGLTLGY
ncbi:MAG TPA: hypothetical protein VF509_04165 [Sphingobium sp.]